MRISTGHIGIFIFVTLWSPSLSIVIRFKQNGRTSTFNYSHTGLTISLDDSEKCMPEIGCFSAGPPFFHPVHRPVSLLPQDRDVVATGFLLYTRRNPFFFQFLRAGEPLTVIKSNFLLRTETKIIVPGWMDNLKVSNWMQDMKDALLNYANCNVIIVDWSKTNGIPFALAVANSRVVGAEIALLVNYLQKEFRVPTESVHIIGHSLGTEIAGYAGQRIKNLGRITALDPAGPYFRNVAPKVRLDPSDALFVDVIHADSSDINQDHLSRLQQTGHIDFYPNGGQKQPGCPNSIVDTFVNRGIFEDVTTARWCQSTHTDQSLTNNLQVEGKLMDGKSNLEIYRGQAQGGTRNLLVCDHYKVIDYFLATIPNHYGCRPVSLACSSWSNFISGKCSDCGPDGSQCTVMGLLADKNKDVIKKHPPRKYYLYTSRHPPFCVQQYHVTLKLGDLPQAMTGEMHVTLIGRYGSVKAHMNKWISRIVSKGDYRTIVTSEENIGVHSVIFNWSCATVKISENVLVSLDTPKRDGCVLYVQSVQVITLSATKRIHMRVCGPETPIPSDLDMAFGKALYC